MISSLFFAIHVCNAVKEKVTQMELKYNNTKFGNILNKKENINLHVHV